MSKKPYDDTFKELVEMDPPAWASFALGRAAAGAEVIDSDLSTVTGLADKVIRQPRAGGDLLIVIEAESSHDSGTPGDLLLSSVLLTRRHSLPVRSVLLLLRPEANATAATGRLERREAVAAPEPYLSFTYHVVRLWVEPMAPLLAGPLPLAPLALLTNEAQGDIDAAGDAVLRRVVAETSSDDRGRMIAATGILMGLRYESPVIEGIIRRAVNVEDNTFVQGMLRRGELRNARATIIRQGRIKLGVPRAEDLSAIEAIADIDRLGTLSERLLRVDTWEALLAEESA